MPQQLSVEQARAWMAETLAGPVAPLLLDVREPWEAALASIRIEGVAAKLVPMGELPARLDELDPAQPILCYCHHGVRSLQVVAFLERQGYASVYNLAGGIDAWSCEADVSVPRY
jgi:rhodanese-related sulfurtransferase